MAKIIWSYDLTTKTLVGDGVQVDDDYTLKDNETFVAPVDGLLAPIKWTGSEWQGVDIVTWQAAHPVPVSTTAQALAALSYQVMQGQQTITQNQDTITALQQSNAQLAYQVMTNGGNA